ncbi:MAG TPA: hypothetical protein DDW92_00065 [Candidatus Veblenbacteria bacterium]|uniref:UPF0235 protein A2588_00960 n=4 Tax=Candidatus Vebleniibacteriota TaxID=1817921 RepID=A0A1G2Q983_9BACT|nr:MAG: hypothetical protein UV52_C0011G0009 [Parcubacteria group bacterium GW2011_GWD1_42_9]OHA54769.1 MAG: hypothetical protein A2388_00395 [Candidatus Veblenbacteria bacterium RIFOXYB1_FULL_43_13]OHA55693.1 MAG: hypothetical protein A2226_00630 [Candidatus Veblenbacteria bacterium RIFOXYA2_FULL_43_9]OHA56985.1 MAG: hypothetical protein A2441_04215 [Candidatus Veblenbacteria bacterium RIFOXYC2_FULL_42_11]OHA57085.1 MAG: hypothetical protein A2588_00960 [Candidatus Veblenbacteria bacterium RIF
MCRLKVKVTANAHRPGLVALIDKVLHCKVSSPPVDGRANRELEETLAEVLKLAKGSVNVRWGHMARIKTVEVEEIDETKLFAILRQHLARSERE